MNGTLHATMAGALDKRLLSPPPPPAPGKTTSAAKIEVMEIEAKQEV